MKTVTFPNTESWLAARRGAGIGSSDAPVIVGASPWRSLLELYHEKRGTLPESEFGPKYVEMAKWGLLLEDAIATRYQLETGREVIKPAQHTIVQHDTLPFAIATVDRYARVTTPPMRDVKVEWPLSEVRGVETIVVELKNAHWFSNDDWEGFGDDDGEAGEYFAEPPLHYVVQVQHQLGITGAAWGSIAVLIGGVKFRYADIKRDDAFIAGLFEREEQFMKDVRAGREPAADGSESTKRLLARLHPADTGETIELPVDAIEWANKLEAAQDDESAAKKRKAEAQNLLKQAIGAATFGTLRDGRVFSLKKQTMPEHVRHASEYRVLRKVGAKKGKGRK